MCKLKLKMIEIVGGQKIHIFNIYTIKKRLWRLIRPHYVGLKLV